MCEKGTGDGISELKKKERVKGNETRLTISIGDRTPVRSLLRISWS